MKKKKAGKAVKAVKAAKSGGASRRRKGLRIAQIHWGYPPIIGGVETHLATMLPVMVKMGNEVHLLTGSVQGVKASYTDRGVRVRRSPLFDLNWLLKRGLIGLNEEIDTLLARFFKAANPDIVHVHNMHYFSKPHAVAVEEMCKKRGVPLVLTAHNVWDELLYLELTRTIAWDHIIAVSHYIRRELIGAGCDDQKVTTIHHGVDTAMFHPDADTRGTYKRHPMLKGRQMVFHPARMGIAKGCDVAIKALTIIRQHFPDVMMVLAGTKNIIDWAVSQQKDIAYFVNLIKYFNLEGNVLVDAYSIEEMPGLYAASDVVIYPSTAQEPFGLTMLESLATGKPIVVTHSGGMPEIVSYGINGYVVPIKDFEQLASEIVRLLEDKKLARRLGATGRRTVTSYYTKESVARNTLDLYREVLGSRPAGRQR